MLRKPQPSLFSIHHEGALFAKIQIKQPRLSKQRNRDVLEIKVPQGRHIQDSFLPLSKRSNMKTKRESQSLNRPELDYVSRSHQWKNPKSLKQNFFSPKIKKHSPFKDSESISQPYEPPLRYGKFLVRVFDGNLRQIRPKSACRLNTNVPRTFKARKSLMLCKPLSLAPATISAKRKSLRSQDLTLQALKKLSSEPKYPPLQNKNTNFTDLFHNYMKRMEKINSKEGERRIVTPRSKKTREKNQSLSNRGGTGSYNGSIDSTKISISSRIYPETRTNEALESGRDRVKTPRRQKTPIMHRSRIEYSFRKALKSEFKQIIENSPLLGNGEKKKKPIHRRVKSNGSDAPPKIVINGTKPTKGGAGTGVAAVPVSPKTESIPRFSAKDRKKIQQILKIGKQCEVDLSKVNLSKRQKPYELAKSLEREIRQKADIHNPTVREELINLNRVCLTLSDLSECESVQSPQHTQSNYRTFTYSSNDSELEDFFERQLLY